MEITPIANILPAGIAPPTLNVLIPDATNYSVLLLQPHGHIDISSAGVRNRDQELSKKQFGRFLQDARDTKADVAITPEYSMPWDVLTEAIKAGTLPSEGKVWILGCESIRYSELQALKTNLAPIATLLYEALPTESTRFLDPLAYVFVAPTTQGHALSKLVVLIQFKTHPMSDKEHFEVNGLQRGSRVYQLGEVGKTLRLVSLICSDAFALKDEDIEKIYDRSLIIHIQLNSNPRQEQYRQYRDRLFGLSGDATELVCLNWARNVHEWCGVQENYWNNNSSSAWYLKPDKFDDHDNTLCANHKRGLYYTWFDNLKTHCLFFNFNPATYLLEATKVAHVGVIASLSRRRGPQLTRTCVWSDATESWVQQDSIEAGFSDVVGESDEAKDELLRIADRNPLEAERVLALCAGKIKSDDWHELRQLDSCRINASEVIYRLTFCQETDQDACEVRVMYFKRCGNLWNILKNEDPSPRGLPDFKQGFSFAWKPNFPHQNAISSQGKLATVIYMGEESSDQQIDKIFRIAAENLRKGPVDNPEGRSARQRLVVWYRKNSKLERYDSSRLVGIDQSGEESEVDIARES